MLVVMQPCGCHCVVLVVHMEWHVGTHTTMNRGGDRCDM